MSGCSECGGIWEHAVNSCTGRLVADDLPPAALPAGAITEERLAELSKHGEWCVSNRSDREGPDVIELVAEVRRLLAENKAVMGHYEAMCKFEDELRVILSARDGESTVEAARRLCAEVEQLREENDDGLVERAAMVAAKLQEDEASKTRVRELEADLSVAKRRAGLL